MSDDEKQGENEVVRKMGDKVKPDVPAGLMVIPKGMSGSALARATAGHVPSNKCEFHCAACGWPQSGSGTLEFEPDEIEALGGNVRDYTGPCPGCKCMLLAPRDLYFGADFPSMSQLAQENKRADARVQAEEFADALVGKVGDVMGGGMPKPTGEPEGGPAAREDLPNAADPSKLTPR